MGFISSLFGSGTACSKCGKKKKPLNQGGGGPKIFICDPVEMRQKVLKCYDCGQLVCGDCAYVSMGAVGVFKCPICRGDMGPCDA